MRSEVVERLLSINRGFYQSFAEPFRATRGRLQPGVIRALEPVPPDANVLDLGCAHGVLAEALLKRSFSGNYVGLDSSRPLLDSIPEKLQPPRYQFAVADLGNEEWPETASSLLSESLATEQSSAGGTILYDWVFAFAILHHLPSSDLRKSTASEFASLLRGGGRIAVSAWDFLASLRLRDRIVAWETVDLRDEDVEQGDYLVDWREGGSGVRYVHHFTQDELRGMAEEIGYRVAREYRSDGENGRLGLYQIWEAALWGVAE